MLTPDSTDRLVTAAADRADSAAQRLLKQLLRKAGITGWQMGVPFGPYTIDVAFPDAKVAIEVAGWAWHAECIAEIRAALIGVRQAAG